MQHVSYVQRHQHKLRTKIWTVASAERSGRYVRGGVGGGDSMADKMYYCHNFNEDKFTERDNCGEGTRLVISYRRAIVSNSRGGEKAIYGRRRGTDMKTNCLLEGQRKICLTNEITAECARSVIRVAMCRTRLTRKHSTDEASRQKNS